MQYNKDTFIEDISQYIDDDSFLEFCNSCKDYQEILQTVDHRERIQLIVDEYLDFTEYCDWDKMTGFEWSVVLSTFPQFANKCEWSKLQWRDWVELIIAQPQFADKCSCWGEINGDYWRTLLITHPQFADKCKWHRLSVCEWNDLLKAHPQFTKYQEALKSMSLIGRMKIITEKYQAYSKNDGALIFSFNGETVTVSFRGDSNVEFSNLNEASFAALLEELGVKFLPYEPDYLELTDIDLYDC